MSFHGTLPHWFLLLVIIVVAIFVIKALVKVAIIIGAIGLAVYLAWTLGLFERVFVALPAA